MGERMVIVIEYDATTDPEQALTEAMIQIRGAANRLDPKHIKVVQVHVAIKDCAEQVLEHFKDGGKWRHKP